MRKSPLYYLAAGIVLTPVLWFGPQRRAAHVRNISEVAKQETFESDAVSATGGSDFATGAESAQADPRFASIFNSSSALPERLAAVEALRGKNLNASDLAALRQFWLSPLSEEPFAAARERALRNGLMNALRERDDTGAVFVPVLAVQIFDVTQDPGMRDYAVQHLAAWHPELDATLRGKAEGALRRALEEPTHTLAGTALLGLRDLGRRGFLTTEFDAKASAVRMATDASVSMKSRMTALALAAELGANDKRLIDQANAWSADTTKPMGARLSAQALLASQSF